MGGTPMFEKCCFCIELKTGCFIIGYLNLIGTVVLTVMAIFMLLAGGILVNDQGENSEKSHMAGTIIMVVGGIMLLVLILALAFAVVLIVGLHKNKPGHLKAYMIFAVIFLVLYCISFLVKAFSTPNAQQIVQDIITILLNIYFLLVIKSQYHVMKDGPRNGPAIYTSA